ncbi:MAG: hypothetical protein V4662_25445 [Verrucomicrobiota bacterium]
MKLPGRWHHAILLAYLVSGAASARADTSPSGISWRVGAGSSYRTMGGIRFETGSYSGSVTLPQLVPASSVNQPFGPETGFADRTYGNGFVFQDINTANPGAILPGTTAFWGYTSNDQVQGGSLVFTGTGTRNVFSQTLASAVSPSWKEDREGSLTPSLDVTGMISLGKGWHLGASLGFMAPRMETGGSSVTFRGTQQTQQFADTVTDTYALQGVVPPQAPYTGVFNPAGPMPVIDNVPTSRVLVSTLTGTQTAVFSNETEETLELDFYIFSLGPVIEYQRGPWTVGGSLGVAVNLVDWRASFKETLTGTTGGAATTVGRWEDSHSDLDVLGGFYLQCQAAFAITPRVSISTFGRHDWMSALSARVGPSGFRAVLDGFTFGAALQLRF